MGIGRVLNTATALLACLACLLIGSVAGAQTLTIVGTTVSETMTRDGRTLTLGYQISNTGAATAAYLTATLVGPVSSNDTVTDMVSGGTAVSVAAGTNWYYRSYLINLGPGASQGSTKYYTVNYVVNWGSGQSYTKPKTNLLTMQSPLSVRIPCIMYHKIGDALYSQYWNTTTMLDAQMAALKAYGYTSVTCRELMDYRAGNATPPAKPVMITFDGGYENFYLDAMPIISKYGYKPVLFLLTGVMGQDNSWDGDNNPVIMFMTWDEVGAAYGSHNLDKIDLQSHTVTHPDMTRVSTSTNNYELTHSRELIQQRCPDDSVQFFCYPYGAYNTTVEKTLRSNGYVAAWAAWGGVETNCTDKYALKRIPIYWDTITDYDSSKSSSFFFNEIGESITIPTISVDSTSYVDAVTGASIPGNRFQWGQTIRIRVTATNSGPSTDVGASLMLDNDSNLSNGIVYDSHAVTPATDIYASSWTGQRVFEWLYTVPIDAPSGQYYATIYFRDKFYVLGFKKGTYVSFSSSSDLTNLSSLKGIADDTPASVKGGIVTAAWPDCFYVENTSRTLGIRVEKTGHGLTAGSIVNVSGRVTNNSAGERIIAASIAQATGTGSVKPVGLTSQAIGGGPTGHQTGIWMKKMAIDPGTGNPVETYIPGTGLNNTGLLVRTWGAVRSLDTVNRVLTIDDGSGTDLKCVYESGVSINPTWTYVTLTGISSCEKVSGQTRRVFLIVSAQSGQ